MAIEDVPQLVDRFRSSLDLSLNRFRAFYNHGIMVEGWFKGELITILDSFQKDGIIDGFDREVRIEKKRVDLSVEILGCHHWIELKHWLNGYQAGTFYGTSFYFSDPTSVGIINDVKKLTNIVPIGFRWALILAVSNPGIIEWTNGINKFNEKFHPYHLISRTEPADYPEEYFLGLLEIA
jgi:hypothetical protein